jgi:hypothetical protein
MGRAGVLQPFALGHYGLLGARGIRLSWSALGGKRHLLCWQDGLGVVALASIDTGKEKKPGLVAQAFIDAGKKKPGLVAPSSTQEKRNLVSSPKASIGAGKK